MACLQQAPKVKIIPAILSLGEACGTRPDLTQTIVEALNAVEDRVVSKFVKEVTPRIVRKKADGSVASRFKSTQV